LSNDKSIGNCFHLPFKESNEKTEIIFQPIKILRKNNEEITFKHFKSSKFDNRAINVGDKTNKKRWSCCRSNEIFEKLIESL
jgi:hypothetical protein